MAEAHAAATTPPIHPGRPEGVGPPAGDVQGRRILWTILALLVGAVIAFLAVTWLINLWTFVNPQFLVPDNIRQLNVQVTPEGIENRRQFQQTEQEALQNYRVLNAQQGTYAIPIDRAKELILQRGLPVRSQNEQQQPAETAPGSAGERSGHTLQESQQRFQMVSDGTGSSR